MTEYNENEVSGKTSAMVAVSKQLAINDQKSLEYGLTILAQAKTTKKEIETWFNPLAVAAYKAHKEITQRKADTLRPIENIIGEINKKATDYHAEQEAARKKEQAKLDEITRKKEEAEKERLLKQAVKAEEKGDIEKAEGLLEQAETTFVAPTILAEEKRVETESGNSTFSKDIEIIITDEMSVYAEIIAGRMPLKCAPVILSAVKQWAKAVGKSPGLYPGFTIRETSRLFTRGK